MKWLSWLLLGVVCGAAAGVANGQQDEAAAPVRVARLAYFSGAVDVARADNTAQDEPVLNMPLGEGTRLSCGDYGQAEVEFEDGSLLRITPRSAVALDSLALEGGVARTAVTVLSGLVYFELRKSPGYSYLVTAGGVLMSPLENAVVRVGLGDGPATLSVISGSVRAEHGYASEVRAGQTMHADAKDPSRYLVTDQIAVEGWDSWNADRDRTAADETEKRTDARDGYAGVQGYGWSDLDANGTWYNVPGEGQVWQPAAADDEFDPYGYGDWVWQGVSYVWASGYQWGWTPYRCGQWEYFPGFGWGWQPDARCGRWGSGGGGVLVGRRQPPHYRVIPVPPQTPGKKHPILIVHQPDGPRPPLHWGTEQVIRGVKWTPLTPVGGVARVGPALGLSRDYPVNLSTHLAVAGRVKTSDEPLPEGGVITAPSARPSPGAARSARQPLNAPSSPGAPSRPAPDLGRTAIPVQAPVRTSAPVAAPRPAPAPPSAPVYHAPSPAPAPPPPPPPAAPAHVDTTAKPK